MVNETKVAIGSSIQIRVCKLQVYQMFGGERAIVDMANIKGVSRWVSEYQTKHRGTFFWLSMATFFFSFLQFCDIKNLGKISPKLSNFFLIILFKTNFPFFWSKKCQNCWEKKHCSPTHTIKFSNF